MKWAVPRKPTTELQNKSYLVLVRPKYNIQLIGLAIYLKFD